MFSFLESGQENRIRCICRGPCAYDRSGNHRKGATLGNFSQSAIIQAFTQPSFLRTWSAGNTKSKDGHNVATNWMSLTLSTCLLINSMIKSFLVSPVELDKNPPPWQPARDVFPETRPYQRSQSYTLINQMQLPATKSLEIYGVEDLEETNSSLSGFQHNLIERDRQHSLRTPKTWFHCRHSFPSIFYPPNQDIQHQSRFSMCCKGPDKSICLCCSPAYQFFFVSVKFPSFRFFGFIWR